MLPAAASQIQLHYWSFIFTELTGLSLTVKTEWLLYLPPIYPPYSSSFIHQRQFSQVTGSVANIMHEMTSTSHNFPYSDDRQRPIACIALTLRLLMSYIYGAPSKARNANWQSVYTQMWHRKPLCIDSVLKQCAANRKRLFQRCHT